MKLSIITINYNNLDGLIRTVDSVAHQTFRNFEYIIIDGGSIDGSKEYIQSMQKHFDYWISEPDTGIYDAMNKGIKIATGEYLLFLNSGDYLYDSKVLLDVSGYLIKNKKCDYVGDAIVIKGTKQEYVFNGNSLSLVSKYSSGIIHQCIFFFNFDILYDIDFKIFADRKLLVERHKKIEMLYIPKCVVYYDGEGFSSKITDYRRFEKNRYLMHFPALYIKLNGLKGVIKYFKFWIKDFII